MRVPIPRPTMATPVTTTAAMGTDGSSNCPANSARSAVDEVAQRVEPGQEREPLGCAVERQEDPGQQEQREQERLLDEPEQVLLAAHGQRQRVRQRPQPDPEDRQQEQADGDAGRFQAEPERRDDEDDEDGLQRSAGRPP